MNYLLFAQQGNHGLGSIIWRNVITKLCLHLVVALEHSLATIASWKDKAEMMGDIIKGELIGKELWHHLTVGNEVDKTDILHFQNMIESPSHKTRDRSFIAYHLWHAEECCFESSRTTRYESASGM